MKIIGAIPGGGASITLETNGALNGSQVLLNLVQSGIITLSNDGVGNITINAPAPVYPVTSVAGKTGAVVLAEADIAGLVADLAAKAPLASPAFTGTPTAPTPAPGDNSTSIATTAFVDTAVAANGLPYPDSAPSSPNALNDEFNSGSVLNPKWTVKQNTLSGSSFFHVNQDWPSWLLCYLSATGAIQIYQTFAGTNNDISFTIKAVNDGRTNFEGVYLWCYDSTFSNGIRAGYEFNSNASNQHLIDITTFASGSFGTVTSLAVLDYGSTWYIHLQRISNTWGAWFSNNGLTWALVGTVSLAAMNGTAAVNLLLQLGANGAPAVNFRQGIDWVRANWIFLK